MAEQAVVDGIVFRAIRRKMTHAERATQTLAQLVQLLPKQRHAITIAAAAIGQQQDRTRRIVAPLAQSVPPAANCVTGQLAGVGCAR